MCSTIFACNPMVTRIIKNLKFKKEVGIDNIYGTSHKKVYIPYLTLIRKYGT